MSFSIKLYTKCYNSVQRTLCRHQLYYKSTSFSTMPQLCIEHRIAGHKFIPYMCVQSRKYCSPASDLWERAHASKYCPPPAHEVIEVKMRDRFENRTEFSYDEWEEFRIEMLNVYFLLSEANFDSITMNALLSSNNISLAQSFMEYLKKVGTKPNLVTNSKYMVLCSKNPEHCSQDVILNTFNNMKSTLDLSLVLDNITVNCVVQGLCMTDKWRKSFEYLKKLPLKNPHYDTKNAIAIAALKNDDEALGWNIITTWYQPAATASNNVFTEYVRLVLRISYRNFILATSLMTKLLEFLQARNVMPDLLLAKEIKKYFMCHSQGWEVTKSKINRSGRCSACKKILESSQLTAEEFESLKEAFFEKSLHKSDIFINTTRDELGKFVMFIGRRKPFDFVVDGLNAAYLLEDNRTRKHRALQLFQVVNELSSRSNKILVLGRQHMKNWPKTLMDKIRCRASLFLTNNASQDDPFLIYAALASGPDSLVVSSDLMRDHMSRLNDPTLIKMFNRWQQSHQVYVNGDNNSINFMGPLKHSICIQGSMSEGWHIPYDDAFILEPYETLNNWLCVHPIPTTDDNPAIDINSFYK